MTASRRACSICWYELDRTRKADPSFEAEIQRAKDEYAERLEAEAHRRAVEGVDEPVFWQGEEVGAVRKYSDRLLELMLKKHNHAFREKFQAELEVKGGVLIVGAPAKTEEEWRQRYNPGV